MFASEDLFKPNQGTTEVARPSSRSGGGGLFSLGNNNRPAQTTANRVAELTAPIQIDEPTNNTNKVNIDEYLYATDDKGPVDPALESDAYNARPGTRGRDRSLPREPDRINTGNDRPPSAPRPPSASMNTRQKLLQQQKMNLLEKQKQNFADMVNNKSDVQQSGQNGQPSLSGFRQPEIPNFNPGTALGNSNANNTTMSQSNNPSMAPKVVSGAPLMGQVLNFPTFNIFTNNIPGSNPVKFTKNDDAPAPPPPEPVDPAPTQVLKVPLSVSAVVEEEKKEKEPTGLEKVPPITGQSYAPARPQSGKPQLQKQQSNVSKQPEEPSPQKKKNDAQAAAEKEKEKNEDEEDLEDENEDGENIPVFPSDTDIPDMKSFVLRPAPKNCVVQCTIKREKGGMARFFPKYSLYFSEGLRFIMTGKKRPNNKTSNYGISVSKGDVEKGSESYVGKLRSNFVGTEFVMYDHGENPSDTKDISKVRREYGAILYEQNFLGERGPRKMKILIPELTAEGDDYINYKPLNEADSMIGKFKAGNRSGMRYLFNKPPKWNDEVSAFVLNFHGRVDKPSVKNFQLIDTFNEDYVYMQFGRVGDDMFNMDIRWPMSLMQGFAIALSSFDFKLACE